VSEIVLSQYICFSCFSHTYLNSPSTHTQLDDCMPCYMSQGSRPPRMLRTHCIRGRERGPLRRVSGRQQQVSNTRRADIPPCMPAAVTVRVLVMCLLTLKVLAGAYLSSESLPLALLSALCSLLSALCSLLSALCSSTLCACMPTGLCTSLTSACASSRTCSSVTACLQRSPGGAPATTESSD